MSRHASRVVRRAPVVAVVVGALVAGGLADRAGGHRVNQAVTADAVRAQPVAAPAGAYSSSWFCAGATDGAPNDAAGQILVANAGSATATGTVTVVPSSGSAVSEAVSVGPDSLATVAESVPGGSPWVGAIVDIDAGAVAVSQLVDGPLGRSTSPCATSGSQHWYFPAGQTRVNAAENLLLLNPYPTDSIVDLSFSTDQGVESPQEFQAIDVPPGGLVAVPIGTHLRRRASIATTVAARSGNVVAWETAAVSPPANGSVPLVGTPAAGAPLADPAVPVPGVMVTLGAPSPGSSWVWPDGLAGPGLDEEYVIYNPGPGTAAVRLSVSLPVGSAAPFVLDVGPFQVASVISEQQARIPPGVAHSATVVSTNGVPVVVTRTVTASQAAVGGGGTRTGRGQMLGERAAASRWVVAVTATDAAHVGQVVIDNPGPRATTVSVEGLQASTPVPVRAGGRAVVEVPAGATAPLIVTAGAPIYVEYNLYGVGTTTGYDIGPAVPLS